MTRAYIARRLLEHGPLHFREFVEITGWPPRAASKALALLKRLRKANCVNHERYSIWSLN